MKPRNVAIIVIIITIFIVTLVFLNKPIIKLGIQREDANPIEYKDVYSNKKVKETKKFETDKIVMYKMDLEKDKENEGILVKKELNNIYKELKKKKDKILDVTVVNNTDKNSYYVYIERNNNKKNNNKNYMTLYKYNVKSNKLKKLAEFDKSEIIYLKEMK